MVRVHNLNNGICSVICNKFIQNHCIGSFQDHCSLIEILNTLCLFLNTPPLSAKGIYKGIYNWGSLGFPRFKMSSIPRHDPRKGLIKITWKRCVTQLSTMNTQKVECLKPFKTTFFTLTFHLENDI